MLATNWFRGPFQQLADAVFEHHCNTLLEHNLNVGWQKSETHIGTRCKLQPRTTGVQAQNNKRSPEACSQAQKVAGLNVS